MYSFPENNSDLPDVIPFFLEQDTGMFGFNQGAVFLTKKDGRWDDPLVWESTNGEIRIPDANDTAIVRHSILLSDVNNYTVNALFVYASLIGVLSNVSLNCNYFINHGIADIGVENYAQGLNVMKAFKNFGTLRSRIVSANINVGAFTLNSQQNIMGKIDVRNQISIRFYSTLLQYVEGREYWNLVCRNGMKIATGNIVCYGFFYVFYQYFYLCQFNLTVYGACQANNLYATDNSYVLCIGATNSTFITSANTIVEFRGGAIFGSPATASALGTLKFTTNNQTWTRNSGFLLCPATVIIDEIELTLITAGGNGELFGNVVNGTNSSSKLINTGTIQYRAVQQPMQAGVLDCGSNPNSWTYNLSGDQEVKGTTYRTLEFGDSGVKKLMGNVVVDVTNGGGWSITGTATIDYNGFTITTI